MGPTLPELSLDLGPVFVPKTISGFLRELSMIKDSPEKVTKLNDYVKRLEDEMRKIDAFKRELPLCMLLLNDAIEKLKEEAMQCREGNDGAVMEEFIPLKGNSDEEGGVKMGNDCSDKKSWMSSAQLWSTNNINYDTEIQNSVLQLKRRSEVDDRCATENPFQVSKYRNKGGAFMPFKTAMKEDKEVLPVPGLSLMTPGMKTPMTELGSKNLNPKSDCGYGSSLLSDQTTKLQSSKSQQQQTIRKQRRCWSPELHRRFVNALQRLGGTQAATPKQIRELMQVDGLTNDEVKSHLQKYRLHIRKLPASSAAPTNGLWMARDQCEEPSKANISHSGSPQGPLHLSSSAKGISITGGDSMEEEEDEKSESHSWKGRLHKSVEDNV